MPRDEGAAPRTHASRDEAEKVEGSRLELELGWREVLGTPRRGPSWIFWYGGGGRSTTQR
jgi:hypothetical protein